MLLLRVDEVRKPTPEPLVGKVAEFSCTSKYGLVLEIAKYFMVKPLNLLAVKFAVSWKFEIVRLDRLTS
jgi:hypothetical protein